MKAAVLRYRVMAYVTGVVLIVLCFVGIPLQIAGKPAVANDVGVLHGILYIIYLVCAWILARKLRLAAKPTVIMLLAGYVRNLATTEADIMAAIQASGLTPVEWMSSYPRMLAGLADPHRFPALAAFIEAGVFEAEDGPDDEFIFGLDRILDGIAVLLQG